MMKAQTGEGTGTFHMKLPAAFTLCGSICSTCSGTFCNSDIKYQYRNDKHSGFTYPQDHFPAGRCTDRIQHYLEDPSAASINGSDPGWRIVPFRFSAPDFF